MAAAAYNVWSTTIGASDTRLKDTNTINCNWLYIRNPTGNATIYVKPYGAAANTGIEITAGGSFVFAAPTQGANAHNPYHLAVQGTQSQVVQCFAFTL